MSELAILLGASSARHSHLCPRQVLGVRMGLAGAHLLGLVAPVPDKGLLVIAETNGCFVDGLEVATGATPGGRTLLIQDFGKVAATFVDVRSGQALRLSPRPTVRQRALDYAPPDARHYAAQLAAYQVMPDSELFSAAEVVLNTPLAAILGRPGLRVACSACGEEVINGREVMLDDVPYCRGCAGEAYYRLSGSSLGFNCAEMVEAGLTLDLPVEGGAHARR